MPLIFLLLMAAHTLIGPLAEPADGIELTEEFRRALDRMDAAEEHVFITGREGIGDFPFSDIILMYDPLVVFGSG